MTTAGLKRESNGRAHTRAHGVRVPKEGGRASSPGGRARPAPGQEPRWPSLSARAAGTTVTRPDLRSTQQEGEQATLATQTRGAPRKAETSRAATPSCCVIAHLEVRCSEERKTNGSDGRACAFRAGTWAPWLYRSLAAGLWARFPSKAHVLTYKGRDARRTGSGGVETRLNKACRVTAESETAFPRGLKICPRDIRRRLDCTTWPVSWGSHLKALLSLWTEVPVLRPDAWAM